MSQFYCRAVLVLQSAQAFSCSWCDYVLAQRQLSRRQKVDDGFWFALALSGPCPTAGAISWAGVRLPKSSNEPSPRAIDIKIACTPLVCRTVYCFLLGCS